MLHANGLKPRALVLVSLKGSRYVYSVITKEYHLGLIEAGERLPAEFYSQNEYTEFTSPFTFTTLNENLPFKMTELGQFRMRADGLPARDRILMEFHLDCLKVIKEFELKPGRFWFDYVSDAAEYAPRFAALRDQVLARLPRVQ